MKDLLMQLQHIFNELKDESENAIIKKYGQNGKRYTVVLIIFVVGSGCFLIGVHFLSTISDIILSRNVSRLHNMLIVTEYFIDQEKYFYLIMLHIYAAIYTGALTVVSTGTLLIAYFQYICGLFKISSYRLERAIRFNMLQNITYIKNKNLMLKGLIYAVDIHRQAISNNWSVLFKPQSFSSKF
ncbi:uncharacterized protein LOC105834270 [Monomorium pharaonis]|uniref:uncharacterized protein LOC105834270 n=1 Tax=Monomorium pharaonis TaxID=307658 RepID=UPI001747D1CD|nr:uncharacterized protein LOC105834270 [Monomorium pharaonis]